MEPSDKALQVLVTRSLYQKLMDMAELNGRSLSGEARYALNLYAKRTAKKRVANG